jgi:RHS repeat-associated protein
MAFMKKQTWNLNNYFAPTASCSLDYYPFGLTMKGRESSSENYRFGFNGMELDKEWSGKGNSLTTSFRQYDPRLGRWRSTDPLQLFFSWQSPFAAFDNNPIYFSDPSGLAAEGGGDDGGVKQKDGTYGFDTNGDGSLDMFTDMGDVANIIRERVPAEQGFWSWVGAGLDGIYESMKGDNNHMDYGINLVDHTKDDVVGDPKDKFYSKNVAEVEWSDFETLMDVLSMMETLDDIRKIKENFDKGDPKQKDWLAYRNSVRDSWRKNRKGNEHHMKTKGGMFQEYKKNFSQLNPSAQKKAIAELKKVVLGELNDEIKEAAYWYWKDNGGSLTSPQGNLLENQDDQEVKDSVIVRVHDTNGPDSFYKQHPDSNAINTWGGSKFWKWEK